MLRRLTGLVAVVALTTGRAGAQEAPPEAPPAEPPAAAPEDAPPGPGEAPPAESGEAGEKGDDEAPPEETPDGGQAAAPEPAPDSTGSSPGEGAPGGAPPARPPDAPPVAPPVSATPPGAAPTTTTAPPAAPGTPSQAPAAPATTPAPPAAPVAPPPQPAAPAAAPPAATASAEVEKTDEEDAEEEPSVPWNAGLSWSQGYNLAGLDKGGEQSFNPEYAWSFGLDLGWTFEELGLSVGLSQGLSIELTDSELTVSRQEPLLSDTSLSARRPVSFELDDDSSLSITPRLSLGLPASKASQASSMVVSTTAGVGASYSYDPFLEGGSLGTTFSYGRRWATSNTVEAEEPFPCDPAGAEPSQDCVHLGGSSTTRDVFVLAFNAGATLVPDLDAGIEFSFGWNLARDLAPTETTTITGATFEVEDDSITHWRNSRVLSFTLGYSWTTWFTSTLFLRNAMLERGPDGKQRPPLKPLDSVLGLTLSFSADQAYLSATGQAANQ